MNPDAASAIIEADLVVIGPGSIRQAHTHDEWISLEQLELGSDLYSKMIERWCR